MDENKNPMQEPGQNPPPPASQPLPWKPNTYTPPPLLTFPMEKRELILALVTLLFSLLLGRCPHCGKTLFTLSDRATNCPKCHGRL